MAQMVTPQLNNTAFQLVGVGNSPEIDKDFSQSLSRMIGYDREAGLFRFINVSGEGYLITTQNPIGTTFSNVQAVAIGTTAVDIVPARSNRIALKLYNPNSADIFLNLGADATTADGFPMGQDETLEIDGWIGTISCIMVAGTGNLRVMEIYQ